MAYKGHGMSYRHFEPIDPREAFTVVPRAGVEDDQSAAASQAAYLLAARAAILGGVATSEQSSDFPLPDFSRLRRRRHFRVAEACKRLGATAKELRQEKNPALERELSGIALELYDRPSMKAVAAMFEAAMLSPHPLVALAGAVGARETTRLRPTIRDTIERCARSKDKLVSRVAMAAMSRIDPMKSLADRKIVSQPVSRKRRRKSKTAVITHGTFAANGKWYRPGGDFYEALASHRPDLHVHDRSFRWTGNYSHSARRADAALLQQWISDQGLDAPDFFAHSHGGTVAHLATVRGVEFNRLVLMGWPVHEQWFPDFSKVSKIIDIRVHMDLVILVDGGEQRFRTNVFDVDEHRNGWFDHGATHDPGYWDEHGLWGVV